MAGTHCLGHFCCTKHMESQHSICVSTLVFVLACRLLTGIEFMRRHGLNKPAVLDTLKTDQAICEFLHLRRFTMNNQDFKARVMIEVRVAGGDYKVMKSVLQIG